MQSASSGKIVRLGSADLPMPHLANGAMCDILRFPAAILLQWAESQAFEPDTKTVTSG